MLGLFPEPKAVAKAEGMSWKTLATSAGSWPCLCSGVPSSSSNPMVSSLCQDTSH